jgi:hypothetical protein
MRESQIFRADPDWSQQRWAATGYFAPNHPLELVTECRIGRPARASVPLRSCALKPQLYTARASRHSAAAPGLRCCTRAIAWAAQVVRQGYTRVPVVSRQRRSAEASGRPPQHAPCLPFGDPGKVACVAWKIQGIGGSSRLRSRGLARGTRSEYGIARSCPGADVSSARDST